MTRNSPPRKKRHGQRRTTVFRDREYPDWLRDQQCCVGTPTHRANARGFCDPAHGPSAGMRVKGPDDGAISLCAVPAVGGEPVTEYQIRADIALLKDITHRRFNGLSLNELERLQSYAQAALELAELLDALGCSLAGKSGALQVIEAKNEALQQMENELAELKKCSECGGRGE